MEQSALLICPTQPKNRMSIHFKHGGTVRHILRLCHIQIPVLHFLIYIFEKSIDKDSISEKFTSTRLKNISAKNYAAEPSK